ncbi:unnamed protein product [Clonostachys byssicola]|uniref:Rhamnogalacturonan I lyase beta-sheet domain-containing protein n=1 Tax=Clonostachys byssicola TaxID=160290 RepID=A0A9N9UZ30_9HYPO|nr:unnamed protein product [Clonostachys byssicola]
MPTWSRSLSAIVIFAFLSLLPTAGAKRALENLGRGVVAVRSSEQEVFISWRLLALDDADIGFNVYRASDGGSSEKINEDILTGGTNFVDSTADLGVSNVYHIRSVVDGKEADESHPFTLSGNSAAEPLVRFPVQDTGPIRYLWVGDLDGDGEYDYVLDRTNDRQSIEAYHRNGTLLWTVTLGANSENQNNISPGSTAISVGHWDGVTVYDFDQDGKAEVALRIANGVTFGNGETFENADDNQQFMAILDGETGALRSKERIPDDFIADGPLAARLGVGYLDGQTPHLVAYMKNRREDKAFNLMYTAWTFDGEKIKLAWKWLRPEIGTLSDGHNTRIIDVDGDGKDEIHEIGFSLNGDGSLRYNLSAHGVIHGDRFHIAKMDPERDGLQGYGIQQDNPSLLMEYYYDADKGSLIWEHYGSEIGDVGRGMAGDIDPNYPGMEVWSFEGVYNAAENKLTSAEGAGPWPHLGLFWDGDNLMELFNNGKIEKWNPSTQGVDRLVTIGHYGGKPANGVNPAFHGDILGDWREEAIVVNENYTELLIFTTNVETDTRLYTLPHNPAYRNSMTLKGYVQSHHVDYFIGHGMETPLTPDITYVGV